MIRPKNGENLNNLRREANRKFKREIRRISEKQNY
jgi:hypothetical protein